MEISILLTEQIIQLFIMILIGFVIVKLNILKADDSKIISKIILYVVIPCMIIDAFQIEYTPNAVQGLLFALVVSIVLQILLLFISTGIGKVFHLSSAELLSIYYSNSGNLIVPIVSYVLGNEWVVYGCVYMCVQVFFVWTHGITVVSEETKFDLKKILTNINVISIMIGLFIFLTQIQMPILISGPIRSISAMTGPLSMIVTGMLLAGMNLKETFTNKRIYFVSFIRLIFLPLLTLIIIWISHTQGYFADARQILLIVFLATITPSASVVPQITQVYGGDVKSAASINAMSTLLSIITMPLLVYVFQIVI